MFRPRKETEDLLRSITKNCETLIKQIHTEPQETLEFKLTQPNETFSLKPSIMSGPDSKRIIDLTSLEVYNYLFNITEEINNFEPSTDFLDEFSFTE